MKRKNFMFILLSVATAMALATAPSISAAFIGQQNNANPEFKVKALEKGKGLSNRPDFVDGEILVKFKNDNKPFRVVNVPKGQVIDQVKAYQNHEDVEYAEPNYIAYAHMVPNDPYYKDYQWNFKNINMEDAWNLSTGENVVVAVIDTGIAYENVRKGARVVYQKAPDLVDTLFVSGYDFVNDDEHPNDDNSHGTHVAGTIAQSTNNSLLVAGVAYNAKLMPIKVLDSSGSGTYDDIIAGIGWAVANGADVINMSLGGSASSVLLEEAVNKAVNAGVVVVASAGNGGNDGIGDPEVGYPARYESVIAVGAVGFYNELAGYSNYGLDLDIVAPGGNGGYYIWQNTFNPDSQNVTDFSLWGFQGTSMAAPHVAGVAALLASMGKTDPVEIRAILESTAKGLGSFGWDQYYGHGLLDAHAALSSINTTPIDSDGDGYDTLVDCNDSDPTVNPGAVEILCDSVDNDCNAITVDVIDNDNDGYSQCGNLDCDDSNQNINPGEEEVYCDMVDNDCNALTADLTIEVCDGNDNDCDGEVDESFDEDGDFFTVCGGDCDDNNIFVNPFANEVCDDEVDNNCDGRIDEGCEPVLDCSMCFKDVCDGYCHPRKDGPGCPDCQ